MHGLRRLCFQNIIKNQNADFGTQIRIPQNGNSEIPNCGIPIPQFGISSNVRCQIAKLIIISKGFPNVYSNCFFNIKKHTKWKRMLKHVFNLSTKLLQFVQMLWQILCFLNVVSLHMMPLRAILQQVRVQPSCSNSLFNMKNTEQTKTHAKACFSAFAVFFRAHLRRSLILPEYGLTEAGQVASSCKGKAPPRNHIPTNMDIPTNL